MLLYLVSDVFLGKSEAAYGQIALQPQYDRGDGVGAEQEGSLPPSSAGESRGRTVSAL